MHLKKIWISGLFLTCLLDSEAHVDLVYPAGGELFIPGQVVEIKWEEVIGHTSTNWDLLYSPGGEDAWIYIAEDLPVNTLSYFWTVPEEFTTTGRIRVIQDNDDVDYGNTSGNFEIAPEARVYFVVPGESASFFSGQQITIQWKIEGTHMTENWDLLFRSHEESIWDTLQLDIPKETLEYLWTIPDIVTEHAQIGIIQDGLTTDYLAVSPDFVITKLLGSSSSLVEVVSVFPNPASDQITFRFRDVQPKKLVLFNSAGQVVRMATIREDELILPREELSNGRYYYKVTVAGKLRDTGKVILK